jgi:hypothetical protein
MRASYQAVAPTLRSRQGRIAGAPGPHGRSNTRKDKSGPLRLCQPLQFSVVGYEGELGGAVEYIPGERNGVAVDPMDGEPAILVAQQTAAGQALTERVRDDRVLVRGIRQVVKGPVLLFRQIKNGCQ